MVARTPRIGIYPNDNPVLQVVPDPNEFEDEILDSATQEPEEESQTPELSPEPEPQIRREPVQEQLNLSGLPANPPVPESDKEILYRITRDARTGIADSVTHYANPSSSRDLIENAIAINERAIAFLVDQTRVRAIEFSIAKTLLLAKVNVALTNALNCYDSEKTVGDALGYITTAFKLMEKL